MRCLILYHLIHCTAVDEITQELPTPPIKATNKCMFENKIKKLGCKSNFLLKLLEPLSKKMPKLGISKNYHYKILVREKVDVYEVFLRRNRFTVRRWHGIESPNRVLSDPFQNFGENSYLQISAFR